MEKINDINKTDYVFARKLVELSIKEKIKVEDLRMKYLAKKVPLKTLIELEEDLHSMIVDILRERLYFKIYIENKQSILKTLDDRYYLKLSLKNKIISILNFLKKIIKIKNKRFTIKRKRTEFEKPADEISYLLK